MCNTYSITKGPQAILEFTWAARNRAGNLAPQPGVYPDYSAPILRNSAEGRELVMARWGMPSPPFTLRSKSRDPGVTNVRNVASPHWRRWLGPENRCVVPFTSFAEPDPQPDGSRPLAWFAFDETRSLGFFAGIHCCGWKSIRKVKEGEVVADLFAFLTCEPNKEVGAIHPKAMPVILRTPEEVDTWMTAPTEQVPSLQRPLPDGVLTIVARGTKEDGAAQKSCATKSCVGFGNRSCGWSPPNVVHLLLARVTVDATTFPVATSVTDIFNVMGSACSLCLLQRGGEVFRRFQLHCLAHVRRQGGTTACAVASPKPG
jgi:putative SOS response-associated peptidase YedK